ncbi:anti-sigmaE protein [Deinococcus phoenicis]|uniref:Regulator of SigK n=1 Tax=Deinococcus phoenicis TaxID=1476583 RepID=A0A016QN47_9DEIO|nr:anti-sigma factor [Deinococcus phoenicis]EYB67488.1 anti-sigmaE protein [Deinococcus phoenicis]
MTVDRDQLIAYALGILPPAEEARVQAALETSPELRATLRAEREVLLALTDALPEVDPPAGAEDRLLARLASEREAGTPAAAPSPRAAVPARSTSWLPLAALSLAAALALAFVVRPPADPLQRYVQIPGAATQAVTANGNTLGQLVRMPDGRAYLHLSQPASTGRAYQMWQVQAGVPVSLGVFEGQGFLLAGLPPGATIAVSVEPPGGSPQPTTTPILVQTL